MKIKQLLEAFETQRGSFPDTSTGVTIGQGYYASVKPDEDPHMVNKKQTRQDTSYAAYVDFLVNNKLAQSNPHFPRIYEVGDGQWKLERLPYTISDIFNDDKNEHYKEMICNIYLKDFDPYRVTSWDFSKHDNIKLGTYRKALELVDAARIKFNQENDGSKKNLNDDLHPGNIMVRLTAQGPQLVITDPWS